VKWLVALLLASFALAGCTTVSIAGTAAPAAPPAAAAPVAAGGAADPPATEISAADRREIEVVETGFSSFTLPFSSGLTRTVAVVVRNPNPTTWTASGVDLKITLRDASGEVIPFDDNARVEVIPPGATRAYAYTREGSGAVASAVPAALDVVVTPVKYWLRAEQVAAGDITIGRATGNPLKARGLGPVSTLQVTCDASSTLPLRPKLFSLVVLYRAAGGELVGGARSYSTIDRTEYSLAPNASTRLEAEIMNPPPDPPPTIECFPNYGAPRL
jgi:hypothetical protein